MIPGRDDTVLVTGASGFVGRATCAHLCAAGYRVRAAHGRRPAPPGTQAVQFDLAGGAGLETLIDGVSAVVHLAGLAHVPVGRVARDEVMRANADATDRIGQAAAAAGARLVFVSSAKVLGESGTFSDRNTPNPADLYAESKWLAEQALSAIPGLDFVVLRPPLIYGPGVGANFMRLMRWVDRCRPLPLASVGARRSLMGVGNLADAIHASLKAPAAAGRAYLVSDGAPIALSALLQKLAETLDRPNRMFPFPPSVLAGLLRATGQGGMADRMLSDFIVDDSEFRVACAWRPPVSFTRGLEETCAWFRMTGMSLA